MIKNIIILAVALTLGGCAVYSDSPYTPAYSTTTYSSGGYIGESNIIVTPAPIVIDRYPNYRYNAPYYRTPSRPIYNPNYNYSPNYNHPPRRIIRPEHNRPILPGVTPPNSNYRPGVSPKPPINRFPKRVDNTH